MTNTEHFAYCSAIINAVKVQDDYFPYKCVRVLWGNHTCWRWWLVCIYVCVWHNLNGTLQKLLKYQHAALCFGRQHCLCVCVYNLSLNRLCSLLKGILFASTPLLFLLAIHLFFTCSAFTLCIIHLCLLICPSFTTYPSKSFFYWPLSRNKYKFQSHYVMHVSINWRLMQKPAAICIVADRKSIRLSEVL